MCDAYEPPRVGEDGKDDVQLKAIPTNSRAGCAEVSTCIMLRLAGSAACAGNRVQGANICKDLEAQPIPSWTHGSRPFGVL